MDYNSVVELLEDPQKFHFKREWLCAREATQEEALLELFSFGTIRNISSHMVLTPLMLVKLQKLTIISLSQRYREIPYSRIAKECQIYDICLIEQYFIELQSFFKVRLDSVSEVATVIECYDCRDVYAGEKPLTVLSPCTLAGYTRSQLIDRLERWRSRVNGTEP